MLAMVSWMIILLGNFKVTQALELQHWDRLQHKVQLPIHIHYKVFEYTLILKIAHKCPLQQLSLLQLCLLCSS